jgi:hypothetical protein
MAGNKKAWVEMKEYQIQDVNLLIDLYYILLPWIKNHPHIGASEGNPTGCKNCGSLDVMKYGYRYTNTGKYQRYICRECGFNMRGEALITGKLK